MQNDAPYLSGGLFWGETGDYTTNSFGLGSGLYMGKAMTGLLNMWGTAVGHQARMAQIKENMRVLNLEKQYNLENFQQKIADTVAQNKMSFYASGLDLAGSPQDVITSNRQALEKDMGMLQLNYDTQRENLSKQKRAERVRFGLKQATNAINVIF